MNIREQKHLEALAACKQNNYRGTINVAVRVGKTIIAWRALLQAYKEGIINENSNIWILSESSLRENTFRDEADNIVKYDIDVNPLTIFKNVKWVCYNSVKKQSDIPDFIIADEIHSGLTKLYHTFLFYKCPILGFSGTIPYDTIVYDEVTKGDLLKQYCPVIFKYSLDEAIKDGINAEYEIHIIKHSLSTSKYAVKFKSGTKVYPEIVAYTKIKNWMFSTPNEFVKQRYGRMLSTLLWESPSKVVECKKLLETLTGNTIIFGERIDVLSKITPHVVSGRSKDNEALIDAFNTGKINIIAASKMLSQGVTLPTIDNVILLSYTSKPHTMEQRLGRGLSKLPNQKDKKINCYILVAEDTLEEKWSKKMI